MIMHKTVVMFVLIVAAFSSGVSADDKVEQRVIDAPAGMLAIPYYAWCNRGPTEMNVWLARTAEKAQFIHATADMKSTLKK